MLLALVASACGGGADGETVRPSPQPTPPPSATAPPPSTGSDEPAARDLIDLAARLAGRPDLPREVQLRPLALGDVESFDLLLLSPDSEQPPSYRAVSATVRAVSEHAYLLVENGSAVDDSEVDAAVRTFEEDVWPAVTGAFGTPPSPGVDGDPRIVILHADLGAAVGGYVSGRDSYPRVAAPRSNQREIVYLNLPAVPLGSLAYSFVLAHELQHLVHLRHDRDEAAWVNEGLSEVAAALVSGGRDFGAFLDRPDTQLNSWGEVGASGPHYQASSLFFAYLLEQTGGDVGQLAAAPANSVEGVQAFLEASGSSRSFDEIVADWAVANLLDEPDGPYGYGALDVSEPAREVIDRSGEGDVRQFAADYLEVRADDVAGEPVFAFQGEPDVPVLAAQPEAAGAFWWSGRGDSIDATLTRELDLTGVRQATLTFRTWFDIERWYDHGYVVASRDGGETWDVLAGRHTTTDDPLEVSYGPGYTGLSGGGPAWVEEQIDFSAYAGSRVLVRFEYVTDGALQRPGWAIDDIAVPEIGFFDDAEADAGGWHRQGFRRLSDPLDQRFRLRLVTFGPAPAVQQIEMDGRNRADVALTGLGSDYQRAVIVVVAVTDGTTEPARYRYELGTQTGQ